jgi:transcriptional regulator with XRE-family HTH domain
MGRGFRSKPARLAEKLRQIRVTLGESQEGMVKLLDLPNEVPGRHYISGFELGTREPTLPTLIRFSELVNCWLDVLVRDELSLPPTPWPCRVKSEGIKRETISSRKKR